MSPPVIMYVSKEKLHPAFGMAYPEKLILIRKDLPRAVQKFVRRHECYHLEDQSKWWVWREIKANAVGAYHHPWGFLVALVLSLTPARISYYIRRWKEQA